MDPATHLPTGEIVQNGLPAAAMTRLTEIELSGADVNTFAALARADRHAAGLSAATDGDLDRSCRHRELRRPHGLGDELRAALVVGGHCWGYMCLHRLDGGLGFTDTDADLLRRLAPHIAHALRQAVLLHRPLQEAPLRPGVVLLDEAMELVATTPEADELLPLIGHGSTRLPLPVSVYTVAGALGTSDLPPSVRVPATTGGWLTLHASRLVSASESRIAVVVEPAEPQSTLGVLLAAYGLTTRELDVARLVLRGDSTKAISNSLHISTHTVQDHLKSVFDKVGVRSRRDLVGHLLSGQRGP
jgi:DNA-binding CsgD family transcriptional regulator